MPTPSAPLPEFRVSAKSLAIDLLSTMPPRYPVAVAFDWTGKVVEVVLVVNDIHVLDMVAEDLVEFLAVLLPLAAAGQQGARRE